MIIYEFTTWRAKSNELFTVNKIEVEEKPKTYIGKHCRINKNDIGVLQNSFGNRMYLFDNNPAPYIAAMKERIKGRISVYEAHAAEAREDLAKWEALSNEK